MPRQALSSFLLSSGYVLFWLFMCCSPVSDKNLYLDNVNLLLAIDNQRTCFSFSKFYAYYVTADVHVSVAYTFCFMLTVFFCRASELQNCIQALCVTFFPGWSWQWWSKFLCLTHRLRWCLHCETFVDTEKKTMWIMPIKESGFYPGHFFLPTNLHQ